MMSWDHLAEQKMLNDRLVFTDCLYRAINSYEYITNLDFDEVQTGPELCSGNIFNIFENLKYFGKIGYIIGSKRLDFTIAGYSTSILTPLSLLGTEIQGDSL